MNKLLLFLFVAVGLICSLKATVIASYDFNGNAIDSSGNSFNGTINGATATTDRFGDPNGAMGFVGGASIWLPVDYGNTSNFTVSVWLQRQQDFFSYVVFNDGWFKGFGIAQGWPDGKTGPDFFAGNGDWYGTDTSAHTTAIGTWINLVGTVDSSGSIKEYLNGNLVGSGNMGSPIVWSSGTQTQISYSNTMYGNSSPTIVGSIDDLQFYNTALTSQQVSQLYGMQSVPEPSTYALFGLGAIGMLMMMRRKKTA